MSVVGKLPFVNRILWGLGEDDLKSLADLLNSSSVVPQVRSLYDENLAITEDDKGVSYVTLYIDELTRRIETGYLVYTEDGCGLFVCDKGSRAMREYEINGNKWEIVYEGLTVEEFRGVLDDITEKVGSGSLPPYTEEDAGKVLAVNEDGDGVAFIENAPKSIIAKSVELLEEAPTEDNPNGLKFVLLDEEPETYQNGYFYIIKGE